MTAPASPSPVRAVDASLEPWQAVRDSHGRWEALLLGNGASCAVWRRFAYGSLYERAASGELDAGLTDADCALFQQFETTNFEAVLGTLATTGEVVGNLGLQREAVRPVTSAVDERYRSVQRALAAAVHDRHVPHHLVPETSLLAIKEELRRYRTVFSTNYDLLIYWAMTAGGVGDFRDLFFNAGMTFDPQNADVPDPTLTLVFWLHGALHMQRRVTGKTRKRVSGGLGQFNDLLSQFAEPTREWIPLVITEGSARQKMAAIERSEYLWHAYKLLRFRRASAVVFGHALGETDDHIVEAIRRWGAATIAVSVWPRMTDKDIMELKLDLTDRLPDATLRFFDSTTHPLGSEILSVSEPQR